MELIERIASEIEQYYGQFEEPVSYSMLNRQWHSRLRTAGSSLLAAMEELCVRGVVIAVLTPSGAKFYYPARAWALLAEEDRLNAPMRILSLQRQRAQLVKGTVLPFPKKSPR